MARIGEGTLRVGPLLQMPEVAAEFGLALEPLFGEMGLPLSLLDDAERILDVQTAARLLTLCAERSGCPHWGLLVGQKAMPASLGVVGLALLDAATVGTALRGLILTLHLNGRAIVPTLVVRNGIATLGVSPYGDYEAGAQQVTDLAIAMAVNLMRALCGPQWAPAEAIFSCRVPADRRPYSRFFRAPLRFDAPMTALVFSADWLARAIPGASAVARRRLQAQIAALTDRQDLDLANRARRALFTLIAHDDVSVEAVSAMLGMHRRTLNRRLTEHGTAIATLLAEVRYQIARQLLADTDLPLVEIAATLNYTDASVFSRAFHTWSGQTPTAWRAQSRRGRRPV